MYANLLLKIAQKLDNNNNFILADKLEKLAQDMSVPFYRRPDQVKDTFKNRLPMQKNFMGNSQQEIDTKFGRDAKIYLQQLIKDPLLFDHPQSKIMLDTIINDPDYKMDRSSLVNPINVYRNHYQDLYKKKDNIEALAEIEPELHKNLNNILSKT